MAQKRKRRDLTLADKYEAVKLLEQKLSQAEVAKRMGCSQPQVHKLSNEVTEALINTETRLKNQNRNA